MDAWLALSDAEFQSPSLRGSGRFVRLLLDALETALVSIPFIAGQWSLPAALVERLRNVIANVSIPFIAGQWSLHIFFRSAGVCQVLFQSPSLRGSGRFRANRNASPYACVFQSPSLRGSGRFCYLTWNLAGTESSFNPLHCGAVVAS